MGPEKNSQVFNIANEAVGRIVEEQRSQEMAAHVLANLSEVIQQYPVQNPVVEPTLLPKLHALGVLNIDRLGVAGPNPVGYVDIESNGGVTINAFTAPAHDSYRHESSGYDIATRVLLFQPPPGASRYYGEDGSGNDNLEIFGLNMFVHSDNLKHANEHDVKVPTDIDDEKAQELLLEAMQDAERKEILVIESEPILGETSIFAVRHRKHGIVKFYSVTLSDNEPNTSSNPFSSLIERKGATRVRVPLPNGSGAEVCQITTDNVAYKDVLKEFSSAMASLEAHRTVDASKVLSGEEISIIRKSLSSGISALKLWEQHFGTS